MSLLRRHALLGNQDQNYFDLLFESEDWAFFFDPNYGITTNVSGVSSWQDRTGNVTFTFSEGREPEYRTDLYGKPTLLFPGLRFSDFTSSTDTVGDILVVARCDVPITERNGHVINLYNNASLSMADIATGINQDLAMINYNADSGGSATALATYLNYDRTKFQCFTSKFQSNKYMHNEDVVLSTYDLFSGNNIRPTQSYTDLRLGRRGDVSFKGVISLVAGTKGDVSDSKSIVNHTILNQIRKKYYQ